MPSLPVPLVLLSTLSLFSPSFAIKCFNCRTTNDDNVALMCDSHCEGDICAVWNYREMSTTLLVQGCLSGADFRSPSSRLKMGCRRNSAGAHLCLCRDFSLCNADIGNGYSATETQKDDSTRQQLLMPMDIRCHSHTWASFITRQLVPPPVHGCQSNLCFFTQTNITRPSSDDPLGHLPRIESSISRSCGPQREFNFDLLLGPLWPGNGLHSDACYQLEDGRGTTLGCSCSFNDCNRQVPYPINAARKRVKCHLDTPLSSSPISSSSPHANFCLGHFCFTQRMANLGYDGQWVLSMGCLSTNESAARTSLKIGYRNILGVEQWLCQKDFCNSIIGGRDEAEKEANDEDEGEKMHFLKAKSEMRNYGAQKEQQMDKGRGGERQRKMKDREKGGMGRNSGQGSSSWSWSSHFCWTILALFV